MVRDPALPALYGRYLYADYCGGRSALVRSSPTPAPATRPTGLDVDQPSSFGEGADGRIYVASLAGSVSRIAQR